MMLTRILLLLSMQLLNINALAGPLDSPKGIRHYETGTAPGFTLADMDGETFQLESARGKWVFLHFWASWCGPCREEMPAIRKMREQLNDDQWVMVLVNTAEDEDTIFSFLAEIGMDMSSLMDSDGLVTEKYKPRGLPTTILIDPAGNVQYQAIGGREWHQPEYIEFLRQLSSNY